MDPQVNWVTPSGRPGLCASVCDGYRIGLALVGRPICRSVGDTEASAPSNGHASGDVRELREPELLFLDHLILEHEIAGAARRRHGYGEGDTAASRHVGRKSNPLVRDPRVIGTDAAALGGEVDPEVNGVVASGRPGLSADI